MTPSIRTFLLINLLLSVILITSLSIIGNLFFEHRDLRNHLDSQLASTALTIQSFVSYDLKENHLTNIQTRIENIPNILSNHYCKNHPTDSICTMNSKQNIGEKIQFQIWDKNGKLLLHSTLAPLSFIHFRQPGFANRIIENDPWRIFVTRDDETGITTAVAERYAFRDQLESQITQDSIIIMLLTYPFLGLLIWIVVGRGLASIKSVAQEVRGRAASYLKAVDLTEIPPEIKPLVNELNELFIRLQAAFQREKRFAADAAHELRTPLAALRAQVQVAINASDPEERRNALNNVLKAVDRSTHTVQQLLTMSRMVPEAAIKDLESVHINREAQQIIADLIPLAMKKNIQVELSAGKEPLVILGNATAVGILIRNLVDNAIRYTPKAGTVEVVTEKDRKNVILKVIDNGPGIPEELRERVFERFFRVVGSTEPGSGLGLGIVQQIVLLHKARVELATPKSGKGLEVRIIFPKSKHNESTKEKSSK